MGFIFGLGGVLWAAGEGGESAGGARVRGQMESLEANYAREPNAGGCRGAVKRMEELPPLLQEAVKKADVGLVQRLVDAAGYELGQLAWGYDVQIGFFHGCRPNPPVGELAAVLKEAAGQLAAAEGAVWDVLGVLDWYEGEDWDERFGRTGFYDQVRGLERRVALARVMYAYYDARCAELGEAVQGRNEGRGGEELGVLEGWLAAGQWTGDARGFLELWRARLGRVTGDARGRQRAKEGLRDALGGSVSAGLEFALRLEGLRLRGAERIGGGQEEGLLAEGERLRAWVGQRKNDLGNAAGALQELALWESGTRQEVMAGAAGRRADQRIYLVDRSYLRPVEELVESAPERLPEVEALVGARLAAAVEACERGPAKASGEWARLLREANGVELLGLARHYGTVKPARWERAAGAYEAFVARGTKGQAPWKQALYDLGECYYAMWLEGQGRQEPNAVRHGEAAVKCWVRLAREYGDHGRGVSEPQAGGTSVQRAAIRAAEAAERLWRGPDAKRFGALAKEAVGVLVGGIDRKSGAVAGPFAQTPAAREKRFLYGLVLEGLGEYGEAARWFEAVEAGRAEKAAARLGAVRCRMSAWSGGERKGLGEGERAATYQAAVRELEELRREEPNSPAAQAAVGWEAEAYRRLGRRDAAVRVLKEGLERGWPGSKWYEVTLEVLGEREEELVRGYAPGERLAADGWARELGEAIALAEWLAGRCEQGDRGGNERCDPVRVAQVELSLVSWGAVAAGEEEGSLNRAELLRRGQAVLKGLERQGGAWESLWCVRCRARLALAAGEYEASRQLWYELRGRLEGGEGTGTDSEWWWEARYFGLRCLAEQGRREEAAHAAEVLLRSGVDGQSPWVERIKRLKTAAAGG